MKLLIIYFRARLIAFAYFVASIFVLYIIICTVYFFKKYVQNSNAARNVPLQNVSGLAFPDDSRIYSRVVQPWRVPDIYSITDPGAWLTQEENCIMAARLNVLKNAGIVSRFFTTADFRHAIGNDDLLYSKWKFNWWTKPLNSSVINMINQILHPSSKKNYTYVRVNNMNELVELAKHKVQVMVHINIYLGPTRYRPYIVPKYHNAAFNHAATIIGIKNYFPKEDIVQFEVYDPFPFWLINETPVYSRLKKDGFNIWNQQATIYFGQNAAEAWYIVDNPDLSTDKEGNHVTP